MKKILLCMVLAGLMMPMAAQKSQFAKIGEKKSIQMEECDLGIFQNGNLPLTFSKSPVQFDWLDAYAGVSEGYDRQTQGSVYPMTRRHTDGFIGCVWTNDDNSPFSGSSTPLRGIGYSCSRDGGDTWSWDKDDPSRENRVGGIPLYWPSYAQWGENGEAILARSADSYNYEGMNILNGLVLMTRENKGEGEWTITVVPYPEGYTPGTDVMAWARMTTSGPNHEYIHIMSPIRHKTNYHPTYYYRTQDGITWDFDPIEVPDLVGEDWPEMYVYTDGITFAVKGDIVAVSFIRMGNHGYVIRTHDNGNTWECIQFFDSPVRRGVPFAQYGDSVYIPANGCVALDNDGKIHVAFAAIRSKNNDDGTGINYWPWGFAQFLSYWNEDMNTIDGDTEFNSPQIMPLLYGYNDDGAYFDWEKTAADPAGRYYVNSTIPKWPVIGYFTPVLDDNYYTFIEDNEQWAGRSYGNAGMFSYPQMAFDKFNKLHLVYLGLLDGGADEDRWRRHPFYTTIAQGDDVWTQTEYLINNLDYINQEFAYLTLAGIGDHGIMYLMAQVDPYAGVYIAYGENPSDHSKVNNHFYYVAIDMNYPPAVNETEIIKMNLYPNPASGKVTVRFDGKGDITIYNIIGQTVYQVENVVKEKEISLNNLTTGVYFVNVRSGNATATQKLIVE